jgi:hypothetical protein
MGEGLHPQIRWTLSIRGESASPGLLRNPTSPRTRGEVNGWRDLNFKQPRGYDFAFPRYWCARVIHRTCPHGTGRRECRVLWQAPAASCVKNKKHTSVVTTGTPKHSGIPRAMVLRLPSCSPRCAGLDSHRRLRIIARKLDASVGAPGPHDFAVRESRRSSCDAIASIASRFLRP